MNRSFGERVSFLLSQHSLLASSLGYGIICGLTFPLMISSTFLQALSLSHGAGNSFGTLFFIAYGLTMLLVAGRAALMRKPHKPVSMPISFACAFLGNVLMLLTNLSIITPDWFYATITSGLVGFGLASAELGWIATIRNADTEGRTDIRFVMPLAFACGGILAGIIFFASNFIELGIALFSIIISIVLFTGRATPPVERASLSLSRGGKADMIKAIFYLAVFSFVFGAISQVAITAKTDIIPIEGQAILGIILASGIMMIAVRLNKKMPDVSNLYGMLFPIVAVALIALPFTTSPLLHSIATVLVFVAYYLASANVRIILCQLSSTHGVSLWVYLGGALGISCLLILGGVAFGAEVISWDNPATGLALISLISLFVLALSPIITNKLEQNSTAAIQPDEPPIRTDSGLPNMSMLDDFGAEHALTARETDVLKLICQGRTRSYIADELGLSPNTVKGYIRNVYQKSKAVDKQDLLDRVELYVKHKEA